MNTFDRHLLREWLQILFLVLAAMLGLSLVQICYDDLSRMLEAGARWREMLQYLLVTMPGFFALLLPVALLISLLFTLTKLHRANELTAMRTAGVGFLRLTAPVWAVGVFACGLVWWLNSSVVPRSVEQSEVLKNEIDFRKQSRTLATDRVGAVYDIAFDNPDAGRLWFFNRYSQAGGVGYGVSVTAMDGRRHPISQILAARASPLPGRMGWKFEAGRFLQFDPETGETMVNAPFTVKIVPEFHEDARLMLLTDQRPRDLSFFELHQIIRYFRIQNESKGVPYEVRYYSIVADTLAPLIVIAIAIPFAVTGVRVNPVVGVSKSMGLFFLYYVFTVAATSMATKGWVEPQWAAWLPNMGMSAVAGWLFVRLR